MGLEALQADYLLAMAPPARLSMVEWAESNVYLSPRESPVPGLIRLSKQQKGILEAIDSGETQFITVLKSARAGMTTIMAIVIAYVAAHRASNILADRAARARLPQRRDRHHRPALRKFADASRPHQSDRHGLEHRAAARHDAAEKLHDRRESQNHGDDLAGEPCAD